MHSISLLEASAMSRFSGSVWLFVIVAVLFSVSFGIATELVTNSQDANTMLLVQQQWENTPPTWKGGDPCGSGWLGVSCNGSRIVSLTLSLMNLTGQMPDEIGKLTALQILLLPNNPGLTGPISGRLGNLQHLHTLILIGCGFTGSIPEELGDLRKLLTLDLNSNALSGSLPPSLGNLTQLTWFDIGNNSIVGQLPVELKGLVNCGHFHFNKNQLNGSIPQEIFHKNMSLIHLLLDHNLLTGEIPATLGNVSTLTIVKLDQNSFEGPIPSSITQLRDLYYLNLSNNNLNGSIPDFSRMNLLFSIKEKNLSNNKLNGSIPDFSGMSSVQSMDLSNNLFTVSNVPDWLAVLESLLTIAMENSSLNGQLPLQVFRLPQLETVILTHNSINGTLQLDASVTQQLQLIDLRDNNITDYSTDFNYTKTLLLEGNPACITEKAISNTTICQLKATEQASNQTDMAQCGSNITCPGDLLKVNPNSCQCAMPLSGIMVFRALTFLSFTNSTRFQNLEKTIGITLNLTVGSVYICCMSFDADGYLNLQVQIFPPPGTTYFTPSEIQHLIYNLSNHMVNTSDEFGPYTFFANGSDILWAEGQNGSNSLSSGAKFGIALAASVSIFAIIAFGIYALRQRRKATRALESSNPFASGGDSGCARKLKSVKYFSSKELEKATNNFSPYNEIGSGGYSKVYRGILPVSGEVVAVKIAKQESKLGSSGFRTELELLSRLHHKNLVALLGFCFEGGKQMLVYEYMPNGSLRDNLSGKTGIRLDWRKRSRIAVGAARGLAYLHDHADPPIIHRDVKSTNILLDENMMAKVSDFGLSKLIPDTENTGHVSTTIKGTRGYLDPEYCMSRQLTQKSDVYSFGVVLMELLASRPPLVEGGHYLVRQVETAMKEGGINEVRRQILDPLLRDSPISQTLVLETFVSLSLRCADDWAANRPKMRDVVKELESIVESLNATIERDHETAALPRGGHHPNHPYASGTSSNSFDHSGRSTMTSSMEHS